MLPLERPITVPHHAFEAASALRNQLDAVAPGKYTVGVGLKQIARVFTNRLALVVYAPEKRPAGEFPEAELVPPEFAGYVTDVLEHRPIIISDVTRYDPLRGGIMISRPATGTGVIGVVNPGTLGAIVRKRQDGRLLLLTNAHVVNPLTNDQVVQPINVDIFQPAQGETGAAIVGTVDGLRYEGSPFLLDCAVIQPNSSRGLQKTVEDVGPVRGVSTELPAMGEVVKKRGARTLLTFGFVVGLVPGALPAVSVIVVSGAVPFVSLFAGKGDSGSVLLNESDQVIGLLFAVPNEDLGLGLSSGGLAMPIFNVQESLQVDVTIDP